MPKVSVIIPIYNAKEYLKRCLDSVCNQTLKDIEIICVDDCSTDDSYKILQDYAAKYSNLKILSLTKNSGESVARNIGMDLATGEYLGFVDNDDEIDLDFYEKLYNKAIITNADISKGEACIIGYDGNQTFGKVNKIIRENNHSPLFFTFHWWTAIFKTSLIKGDNIKFPEGYSLGGDVLFLNKVVLACENITLVDDAFYHYYRREDSGDSRVLSLDKIKSVLDIHIQIIDNVQKRQIKVNKAKNYIYNWCFEAMFSYAFRNEQTIALSFCVDKLFEVYNKIKEDYDTLIETECIKSPIILIVMDYIKTDDKEGLISFCLKNNTSQKRLLAGLRYTHANQKVKI